jgi:predicted glutamine amidotransferase
MCAILGWSGKLPKGLISRLLVKMETRGRDGVGLAFRINGMNKSWRQAVPAIEFTTDKENQVILGDARRSLRGLAHTRRASPGMPINDQNSHPFAYWRYFFAHNGKIQNWQEIRTVLLEHFERELARLTAENKVEEAKTAEYCVNYCKRITTDSMVLGPYIESRDFSRLIGCMALVWMRANNVFTFRYAKEAVASTIIWRYTNPPKDEKVEDHVVTIVSSTAHTIMTAIEGIEGIEYEATDPLAFPEGRIFQIEPTGLVDKGPVPTNEPVADEFSSEVVEADPDCGEATATVTPAAETTETGNAA